MDFEILIKEKSPEIFSVYVNYIINSYYNGLGPTSDLLDLINKNFLTFSSRECEIDSCIEDFDIKYYFRCLEYCKNGKLIW
ncbi:p10 [Tomato infectious chlorosis virus]|uniref:p10 n=1 Tax=Tomato infectious chlorosis virus TaxID=52135 RepID=B4YNS7_9CLOS|nr:p10 [Tomato infectious chlorosis virus]ACF42336.1 p9 [Tomato infectious chlorosis virus]ACN87740.1 p9 [Tomato infectious chlorosis virus]ACN87748.1 p9 [Tomato infectious chlorosis virus]ACS73878.1 p10 [Tomato infectious chlorosis virus]WRK24210.1 10 kDa protein [Tomato infectious chlorosis virus]